MVRFCIGQEHFFKCQHSLPQRTDIFVIQNLRDQLDESHALLLRATDTSAAHKSRADDKEREVQDLRQERQTLREESQAISCTLEDERKQWRLQRDTWDKQVMGCATYASFLH